MSAASKRDSVRVAHTSDWHLGVELSGHSRREDHVRAIDSVVAHCADFAPDVIVHTGDLFDHARPGADDQRLAADALKRLAQIAPLVVVAGNHDPAVVLDRAWGTLATIGGDAPIYFRGRVRRPEDGGIIAVSGADGTGTVYVATIPFVTSHSFAVFDEPGETTTKFTDGIRKVHDRYQQWLDMHVDASRDKVLWAAHLLVDGARPGYSERVVDLGDDFATSAAHIGAVDYAAFGHIHKAQPIPGSVPGRYAGGLLCFQFHESRADQPAKTMVLVELPARGAAHIREVPLDTGRPLMAVTGSLDELAAMRDETTGAFVRVTVDLDNPVENLMARVVGALDGATVVDVIPRRDAPETVTVTTGDGGAASIDDLLDAWLDGRELDAADEVRAAGLVRTLVHSAIDLQRYPIDGEALLDEDLAERLADDIARVGWADPDRDAAVDAAADDAAGGPDLPVDTDEPPPVEYAQPVETAGANEARRGRRTSRNDSNDSEESA